MGTTDDYEFRTFAAAAPDGVADAATRDWFEAESLGFLEPRPLGKRIDRAAANMAADGRMLTGVHRRDAGVAASGAAASGAASLGALPVATFASFERTVNVGGHEPLRTHLISSVTVRPTDRRRGILREMMTADLRRAHADGYALAALTATEATIYRRFGFGVATAVHAISVATDQRFRLLEEPAGRCELIAAAELATIGPAVFAGFHARNPGSVDRQTRYWRLVAGLESEGDDPEEDRAVRAAIHRDDAGRVDGYVSYRFKGWESTPRTVEVVDLVAQNDDAYLGLWQLLGSIDLVEKVTHAFAPVDDPLRWALADWRLLKTTSLDDWLWLRVLDLRAAFQARGYLPEVAGEIVLGVTDALGYASGVHRLRVADGRGAVTRDDDAHPDVEVDASALASIYLGGFDPAMLRAAGLLSERTPGALARLRTLLTPVAPVYGITHF